MKRIGFDNRITLDWLDQIAFEYKVEKDVDKVRDFVDKYVSKEILGIESRKKKLTILFRIWVFVPDEHKKLRDEALTLIGKVGEQERVILHWGLCLLAYPFFRDVTSIIGKLFKLQDKVSYSQIYRRVIETWGERSTLKWAVSRLVRSLVQWGAIQDGQAKGNYMINKKINVVNDEIKLWLIECYLHGQDKTAYLDNLNNAPELFPFNYNIRFGELMNSSRFEINRQGLDCDVVSLK